MEDLPMENTTWKELSELQHICAELNLEDKSVCFNPEGIITPTLDTDAHEEIDLPQLDSRTKHNGESVEELSQKQIRRRLSTRVKKKPPWMAQYDL